MENFSERTHAYRPFLFVVVLALFATSAIEIGTEFLAGETLLTMWDDMVWFVVSIFFLGVFIYERAMQRREIAALKTHLEQAKGKLVALDRNSIEIANQYRAVLQKQFDVWQLSASEQDVVIAMLKGLSFPEIATLRGTREKTVRQQASSVYRKAGVSGRHELTAWFFEDLLDPPVVE